jgi:hypothetical protein
MAFSLVIFTLGMILYLICLISFIMKLETVAFSYGISMGVVFVLATSLNIMYSMALHGSGDYCEQVLSCLYDNKLPVTGFGMGYVLADFPT